LEHQNLQAVQAAAQASQQEAIMADTQASANAFTAALQPMVAAITVATAATVGPVLCTWSAWLMATLSALWKVSCQSSLCRFFSNK
jgi:hypothetical protein